MQVETYLKKVAYTKEVENEFTGEKHVAYFSKYDDSYITLMGQEDKIIFLANREITENLTRGVGFSPKENKWYGWSHRAIYGFQIGSTCKKGDCHYIAPTPEELIEDYVNFFADISEDCVERKRAECQILSDRSGIRILHSPLEIPIIGGTEDIPDVLEDPSKFPKEDIYKDSFIIVKCGKGQWVAKTMEDAKEMAINFSEAVS